MIIELSFIFLLIAISGYIYYKHKWIHRYFDERGIRYLPGVPLFGNIFGCTFSKSHFVEDMDNTYRAFPDDRYVGFIEATTPVILVRDPELMKTITVKDFDHFTDRKQFFPEEVEPVFGASLIMMKGQRWHDMRSTLSPAFTSSKMRQLMPSIAEISSKVVKHLQDHVNEDIDILDVICRYTNDVIASAGFGVQVNSVKDRDDVFYRTGQQLFKFDFMQRVYLIFSMSFPRLAQSLGINIFAPRLSSFFKNIMQYTMRYREKNKIERPDMLQLLLQTSKGSSLEETDENNNSVYLTSSYGNQSCSLKDRNGNYNSSDHNIHLLKPRATQRQWTQNDMAGQVLLFFTAGFDTTSSTLVMCIHELALNPDVQEKLYQEIKKCDEQYGELTYENLGNLKYLDCVLNESSRKWSAAIFMDRVCTKPYELPPPRKGAKPVQLKPGDIVYNLVNSVHMDPAHHPQPHRFMPERFSDENKHNIKPFTYMPFGMGPRSCIGLKLALLEIKIFIYYLFLNFKIEKCAKTTDPIELMPHTITINCKNGTWIRLERRK